MAAKIDVKIGVEDGAFAAFAQKFRAYTDKLAETPNAWTKVSRSSEESLVHFEMITAALTDQADSIGRIATGSTTLRREAESTSRHFHNLRLSTSGVAGNIASATASLLKWSGVTGLVAGLVGGAAAMGFDHMASNVAGNRTAAMAGGTTYGARSSFLVNFKRMTDAEGMLGRVNELSHSADNIPLRAVGLSQGQVQGDSADVAVNYLIKAREKLRGIKDTRFLQDTMHSNRMDEVMSVNQAQVMIAMSDKEFNDQVNAYRDNKGIGKLGLEDQTQKAWQDFATAMDGAGKKIENTFVNRLGALTPGLTRLAESFTQVVDRLMTKNGPLAQWLDKLNEGVEWLAKNIDKPEFQRGVENFVSGIGDVAGALVNLLAGVVSLASWLGISPAEAAEAPKRVSSAYGGSEGGSGGHGGAGGSGGGSGADYGAPGGGGSSSGSFMDALAQIESTNRNIYSRTDPDVAGPNSRSQGFFQINTPTWQDFARRAGVDLAQYPNAMSAPRDVQARVAAVIPLSRFGRRTQRMLRSQFGALDSHTPVGRLGPHPDAAKPDDGKWKETADIGADKRDLFAETPTNRDLQRGGKRPANTTTKVTITKPTGADPHVAAAAAASQ